MPKRPRQKGERRQQEGDVDDPSGGFRRLERDRQVAHNKKDKDQAGERPDRQCGAPGRGRGTDPLPHHHRQEGHRYDSPAVVVDRVHGHGQFMILDNGWERSRTRAVTSDVDQGVVGEGRCQAAGEGPCPGDPDDDTSRRPSSTPGKERTAWVQNGEKRARSQNAAKASQYDRKPARAPAYEAKPVSTRSVPVAMFG